MSQKTVYTCDECEQPIGEKKHISLVVAGSMHSGIALPPDHPWVEAARQQMPIPSETNGRPTRTSWIVDGTRVRSKFLHFHNGQCIGRFFSKLIKEAK